MEIKGFYYAPNDICIRIPGVFLIIVMCYTCVLIVAAISVSIERAHRLRLEVGSYALMHNTGFELFDMWLCCKFAEGDSRILQMKLMRDRLKQVKKEGPLQLVKGLFGEHRQEVFTRHCLVALPMLISGVDVHM